MKSDFCPYLSADNICSIYATRPVACKVFPCPYSTIEDLELAGTTHCSYEHCSAELPPDKLHSELGFEIVNGQYKINSRTLSRRLYARYGDAYLYRLNSSIVAQICGRLLKEMCINDMIVLADNNYDLPQLIVKIQSSPQIDISDLVKERLDMDLKEIFSSKMMTLLKKTF